MFLCSRISHSLQQMCSVNYRGQRHNQEKILTLHSCSRTWPMHIMKTFGKRRVYLTSMKYFFAAMINQKMGRFM
ncbi:hypothetical protein GDO81_014335 [Engystomops pustulosus]|uniref:Uncharacterized protein n=1 Tax=Engystomops pustulosus TaxID=76066 RepID=A0AAV7B9L7_ENGPU|nr:hypothetical protein GDO81_014335 [Engystomops pustulosus]